ERKKGRETWFYTMVEPKFPHPTWLLDDDGASMRAFGPLMARNGLGGFVYSMAHGWGPKPLENLQSFAGTNGDGTLLYPAEIVGGVGPMPSIRLMLLRDAMEDVELKRTVGTWPAMSLDGFAGTLSNDTAGHVPTNAATLIKREGVPDTRVSWRIDAKRQNLIVNFRASKPQSGDYVAVELAPSDIEKRPEKWRFVATRKGNRAVEKRTREGHFRFEAGAFRTTVKDQGDFYSVEMTIPLAVLEGATKFRFDALRRTSVNGAKITIYAHSRTGDPYAMPVIDLQAKRG
ncbi:MAG: DUF4091 domain-containing protein, partial [Armatimonadetes bacterium]|nr:DUF4091 domain-containing protein [Armatimonadota bacterium]